MSATDQNLLHEFVRKSSEDAFASLVRRHLNLVYSAALRQVATPHDAEEVAQCVFIDLARSAHRLESGTFLTAWLYQVTRRTAIDLIRRECRRLARERIVMEQSNTPPATDEWASVAPLLDEAMQSLPDDDRTAILLRFFENQRLQQVGAAFGISEDAAQKRIFRAINRLRDILRERGTPVSTAGLGNLIASNAVGSASPGLGTSIVEAVAKNALLTTSTAFSGKFLTMTSIQKSALTFVTVIAVGTAVYQARRAESLRRDAVNLQKQQVEITTEGQREREEVTQRLEFMADELGRLRNTQPELLRLRGEVAELRRALTKSAPGRLESPSQSSAADTRLSAATPDAGLERFFKASLAGDGGALARFVSWQRDEGISNDLFEGVRDANIRNLTNTVATTTSLRIVGQLMEDSVRTRARVECRLQNGETFQRELELVQDEGDWKPVFRIERTPSGGLTAYMFQVLTPELGQVGK